MRLSGKTLKELLQAIKDKDSKKLEEIMKLKQWDILDKYSIFTSEDLLRKSVAESINEDLKKLKEVMKLKQWNILDKYSKLDSNDLLKKLVEYPKTLEPKLQLPLTSLINVLSESALIEIGTFCQKTATAAFSIPTTDPSYELYRTDITFKNKLSQFDYRLFHLRGYWIHCFIKCFKCLALKHIKNWDIYSTLDHPQFLTYDFEKPRYFEDINICWMHYGLKTGHFDKLEYFEQCLQFYEYNLLKVVYIKDYQRDPYHSLATDARYYQLHSLKTFLELAITKFPNEKVFQVARARVSAIENIRSSECNSAIASENEFLAAESYNNRKFVLYSNNCLEGKYITAIDMLQTLNIEKDSIRELDWFIDYGNVHSSYIKDYSPQLNDKWPRWIFVFSIALKFGKSKWFSPNEVLKVLLLKKYGEDGEATVDYTHSPIPEIKESIMKATKSISEDFQDIHKILLEDCKLDLLLCKKIGNQNYYSINLEKKFLLVLDPDLLENKINEREPSL